MTADLSLDEHEQLITDSVARSIRALLGDASHARPDFSRALWRSFAEQGFFALGTPEAEGGLRAVVAAVEPLGRAVFPGPVVDTFLAGQLLSGEDLDELIAGTRLCVAGRPPRFAYGHEADAFFELDKTHIFELDKTAPSEQLGGLGEPFSIARFVRKRPLAHAERALCVGDVVLSSFVSHAALGLVHVTSEHARTRMQFGRAIGTFQAVSHPLASAHIALSAAQRIARAAACAFDEDDLSRAQSLAQAALISSQRAALEAVYVCHQKLGAIGITVEGPAHYVATRIRALCTRAQWRSEASDPLLESLGVGP